VILDVIFVKIPPGSSVCCHRSPSGGSDGKRISEGGTVQLGYHGRQDRGVVQVFMLECRA
jgi:hypothetical protein